MKYYRVGPHDPNVLHKQLTDAGAPVVTVRSGFASRRDRTAMYGVVVAEDAANDNDVQNVIDAHEPSETPPVRSAETISAAQDAMMQD